MIQNRGAAAAWWRALQPDPPRHNGDRATLARLRRCATIAEAMNDAGTMALFRACGADQPDDLVRVALTAAVLAHVREDRREVTVARQIGPQGGPEVVETALVKPLRFQRLMTAATPDERLASLRRLVALAGGAVNVPDLAEALLFWTEERRRRWTYDYWGVGQPAAAMGNPSKDNAA